MEDIGLTHIALPLLPIAHLGAACKSRQEVERAVLGDGASEEEFLSSTKTMMVRNLAVIGVLT